MVMANSEVEIFNNLVSDHATANILLTSYFLTQRPINDPDYDPYVESIYIYDNTLTNAGYDPKGGSSQGTKEMVAALREEIGLPFPDIIWGGFKNPDHTNEDGVLDADYKICITGNNLADFINLDFPGGLAERYRKLDKHQCQHQKLPAVQLP